ncbi:MAG TPA: glycosyltransferase [Spongiibacteraceae bacterium]|nr:glycosyltransferase [Spongiibacteraceae bacterium]
MTRRELLHVCHSYYPPFLDVARQYNALFDPSQWRITTVFLSGNADNGIIDTIGGDEVIFLEKTPRQLRGLKLGLIAKLRTIAAQHNFVFAIAHRFKAIYLCTQVPGLFTFGVHHRPGGYKRWGRRWYVRWKQSQLAILGVSNFVRDDMRCDLPDFPAEKIETLYNHIDITAVRAGLLARTEARQQLGLPAASYLFGNVGRLHPDKDQATLIRAFAHHCERDPDAMLVIAGKGKLEQELKSLAQTLHIQQRVIFTGPVADAWKYFKAFDAFVLTSNKEPFGMVLLEAMAAELPVVYSACGGAIEVVGDAGLSFELGDESALAQKLEQLQRMNPLERENYRRHSEARLQSYFTDAAVREAFFALPAVARLVNNATP